MKQLITILFLSLSNLCIAQYDVVDNFSQSGGITENAASPERYDVNPVVYLPTLILNVNTLVGVDVLELGKTYTFFFDFDNVFDTDVKLAEINTGCICEQADWSKNTIAPSGKRRVTITFTATVAGEYPSVVKLFVQDPGGLKPMAVQSVQLSYKVQ